MRQLVIAVDCDDVLVPTTPFFVKSYNERYGTNVSLEQSHTEGDDIWGVSHDAMLDRFAEMMKTEAYKQLGPSDDEIRILKELAEHHTLYLVTARKEEERTFTREMLDRVLPDVFTSMEFVGWTGSKGEVCKRLGVDVLIDDNARHLHDAIKEGLPKSGALLFADYPWNLPDQKHDDLTHCLTWQDVKLAVDSIAKVSV